MFQGGEYIEILQHRLIYIDKCLFFLIFKLAFKPGQAIACMEDLHSASLDTSRKKLHRTGANFYAFMTNLVMPATGALATIVLKTMHKQVNHLFNH